MTPEAPVIPAWKRVRNTVALSIVDVLMGLVPRLPLRRVQSFARFVGHVAAWMPGRRRRRMMSHLRIAFPSPGHDQAFRERLYVKSWKCMAEWAAESLWIPAWKPSDDERVRISDRERFERTIRIAQERGKGLVIFASHLGTIEMLAQWFPRQVPMPVMCTAARPKQPEIEKRLRRLRETGGVKMVYRGEAGVPTLRHLKAGGVLIMLVDHNLAGPGVAVPFFGRPAHTLLAPARLALQCGATAVTMFCLREKRGRYRVDCDEPLLLEPPGRDEAERFRAEARLVAEYTARIEAAVRRTPEQYLWMHKRWDKRSETLPLPPLD